VEVVGLLKGKGKGLTDGDQNGLILIPLTTLQQKLVGKARLNAILAAARSVDQVDQGAGKIRQLLRERHRVKEGVEDFEVSSVLDLYNLYKQGTGKKGPNKDKRDRE
jgi:putative ABC transport system permease protein